MSMSDGQQVLVRILRMALSEDERCASVILAALQSADKEALLTEPRELPDFLRAHLTEPLTKEIGPNLTLAVLGDLIAEFESLGVGNDASSDSSPSVKVNTPHVAVPVHPPKSPAAPDNVGGRLPFPRKFRQSVANMVRAASTRLRAVVAASKNGVSHYGERPSVVLVHPDRLARATTARALVNARFDVQAFDLPAQVIPALRSRKEIIVILDVKEGGMESILGALVMANPALAVLAWTEATPAFAETLMMTAGIQKLTVLSKTASALELVDAVRQLARPSSR